MGDLNGQRQKEFLLDLYVNVFEDTATMYPKHRLTLCRDLETLQSRVMAEGLSFLTKTLPSLGKYLDEALDSGSLKPHPSFRKKKGRRNPAFLQGLFSELFDPSGFLVENAPADVIAAIRQICFLVYKMEFPFSKRDEDRVLQSFLKNEEELRAFDYSLDPTRVKEIIKAVLRGFNPRKILPKHGPGAVSTGEKLDEKWEFSRLYDSIHQCYPYYEYFIVGGASELVDRIKWYKGLTRNIPGYAKVVLVPKDSRGPRLISCEPLEYQWIQQGLNRSLVSHLESAKLTRGRINFQDQSVNQELALSSSKNGVYSTIDLKDASDRVSVDLVKLLFPEELLRFFLAVRSQGTTLPDGEVIDLVKYAPMGSAVCFSVEALLFWAISVDAVANKLGMHYRQVADLVYVYGDDIIVPTHCFDEVIQHLEAFGLKANRQKCCSSGRFRESCGVDAFNGINVTPVKLSTVWSSDPRSGSSLASYAAYANTLAERGYYAAAAYLRNSLENRGNKLPYGTSNAGFPCIRVDSLPEAIRKNFAKGIQTAWSTRYQRYKVRVMTLRPVSRVSTLDGWPRLLRHVCGQTGRETDRVVLPRSTQIRLRWSWLF